MNKNIFIKILNIITNIKVIKLNKLIDINYNIWVRK